MLVGGFGRSGEHRGEEGAAAALARGPGSAVWLLGRVKAAQPPWGWAKGSWQGYNPPPPRRHLLSRHHPPAALLDVGPHSRSLWALFQGHRQFWVPSVCRAQQSSGMLSLVLQGGQANCGWAGCSVPATEFLRPSSGVIVPGKARKAPVRSCFRSQAEEG